MDASIVVSLISAAATIGTVIINNRSSNKEVQYKIEVSQAVTNTKLENLAAEVREQNNYAKQVPVIESKVGEHERRISNLELSERSKRYE